MIRNNNPGNLRYYASIPWVGQIGSDSRGFAIFDKLENGVRAMIKTLYNDRNKTLAQIIYEYAPPSENNTEAYIQNIINWTGWTRDKRFNFANYDEIRKLVRNIVRMETSVQDLPDYYIRTAYELLFGPVQAPAPGSPAQYPAPSTAPGSSSGSWGWIVPAFLVVGGVYILTRKTTSKIA